MSIEKSLESIATSLEILAGGKRLPYQAQPSGGPIGNLADAVAEAGVAAAEAEVALVKTGAELRTFAQKIMKSATPEQNTALIVHIKSICAKLSPSSPKLISIPADKTNEAYDMLETYATENGIAIG